MYIQIGDVSDRYFQSSNLDQRYNIGQHFPKNKYLSVDDLWAHIRFLYIQTTNTSYVTDQLQLLSTVRIRQVRSKPTLDMCLNFTSMLSENCKWHNFWFDIEDRSYLKSWDTVLKVGIE